MPSPRQNTPAADQDRKKNINWFSWPEYDPDRFMLVFPGQNEIIPRCIASGSTSNPGNSSGIPTGGLITNILSERGELSCYSPVPPWSGSLQIQRRVQRLDELLLAALPDDELPLLEADRTLPPSFSGIIRGISVPGMVLTFSRS